MIEKNGSDSTGQTSPASSGEDFLLAIEKNLTDPIHLRLLRACRQADPSSALDAELNKVIDEILHET